MTSIGINMTMDHNQNDKNDEPSNMEKVHHAKKAGKTELERFSRRALKTARKHTRAAKSRRVAKTTGQPNQEKKWRVNRRRGLKGKRRNKQVPTPPTPLTTSVEEDAISEESSTESISSGSSVGSGRVVTSDLDSDSNTNYYEPLSGTDEDTDQEDAGQEEVASVSKPPRAIVVPTQALPKARGKRPTRQAKPQYAPEEAPEVVHTIAERANTVRSVIYDSIANSLPVCMHLGTNPKEMDVLDEVLSGEVVGSTQGNNKDCIGGGTINAGALLPENKHCTRLLRRLNMREKEYEFKLPLLASEVSFYLKVRHGVLPYNRVNKQLIHADAAKFVTGQYLSGQEPYALLKWKDIHPIVEYGALLFWIPNYDEVKVQSLYDSAKSRIEERASWDGGPSV